MDEDSTSRSPADDAAADAADDAAADDAAREQRRAHLLAAIPASYSYRLHLAIPTLLTGGICAAAISLIHRLRAAELLMIPAMIVVSNAGEWVAHRYLLHERMPWFLGEIYERHELQHHQIYVDRDMALRSWRELQMILVPAYAVLVLLASVVPFAALAAWLLSRNCAMLVIICSLCYFIAYEWLHLSYHLPATSRIGRLPLVAKLRSLHQTHHDPALMKRFNFNVTVGLFDWINGTLYDPTRARSRTAQQKPAKTC